MSQAQLDEQLAGLQTLTAARRSKLEESIKLHQYLQEVEEVLSWLADKEATASSDDYGKDFEHLLVRLTVGKDHPVYMYVHATQCTCKCINVQSMRPIQLCNTADPLPIPLLFLGGGGGGWGVLPFWVFF